MCRLRAARTEDDDGVLRALARRDLADYGAGDYTRDILLDQWRVREFDPARCAAVAEDAGRVVGYAALFAPGEIAFVDPAREGRGVGSALLSWTESRAGAVGRGTLRQRVAQGNERAQALLLAAGYRQARTIKRMAVRGADAPPAPPAPPGIFLAPLDRNRDAEGLHEADDNAFSGNADYESMPLASFYDEHLASPNVDPRLSRVARRGNKIVGFVVVRRQPQGQGYVDLLAVDPAERRIGLGTALLLTALEAIAQAGLRGAWLEVASDNPVALRLYTRAGMASRGESTVFEKPGL